MTKQEAKLIKKTLHIYGGGPLVGVAESIALENGWNVVLRTGARFLKSLPRLSKNTIVLVGNDLGQLIEDGGLPTPHDLGISISAPWVFSQEVIDQFSGRLFNLHNQPLPRFRGAGGASWRILMRDMNGGVCIHHLTRGIDAGKLVAKVDFRFPDTCRLPADFESVTLEYSKLLLAEWLKAAIKNNKLTYHEFTFSDTVNEYWPRLNSEIHGWINWGWSLCNIQVFCDAFSSPHDGALTMVREKKIYIRNTTAAAEEGKFHPFQTGLVYRINGGSLYVAHPDGTLIVEDYRLEDANIIVRLGDRLFSPVGKLELALRTRIQYLPDGTIISNCDL